MNESMHAYLHPFTFTILTCGYLRDFRHDDLKQMLDSNKDHLKLEAMKRIIGMVAKV